MNPNQSAIQYKAGIRINSSRPFCARPFVIHQGDSFAKDWKDQFSLIISHFDKLRSYSTKWVIELQKFSESTLKLIGQYM